MRYFTSLFLWTILAVSLVAPSYSFAAKKEKSSTPAPATTKSTGVNGSGTLISPPFVEWADNPLIVYEKIKALGVKAMGGRTTLRLGAFTDAAGTLDGYKRIFTDPYEGEQRYEQFYLPGTNGLQCMLTHYDDERLAAKPVTIADGDFSLVVEFRTNYNIPIDKPSAVLFFETDTGDKSQDFNPYMQKISCRAYAYEVKAVSLSAQRSNLPESTVPAILNTLDKKYVGLQRHNFYQEGEPFIDVTYTDKTGATIRFRADVNVVISYQAPPEETNLGEDVGITRLRNFLRPKSSGADRAGEL